MNIEIYLVAKSGEMFVDRVVDDFVDHVMQSALVRVANVHSGAFPDRFQPFQLVDLGRVVLLRFIDARSLARLTFFARSFVVWNDFDGGSGWHRKKVAKTIWKTTNNLVLPRALFALGIGVRSWSKPT